MQAYNETKDSYKSRDGLNIHYRHYAAEDERLCVVISHGLGEHSGRYLNVVEKLCPMGISIFVHDHRGHGKSQGRRGHIDGFDQYIDDLDILLNISRDKSRANTPVILLGHSMGGLIGLSHAINRPGKIDGIAVSSPLLQPAVKVSSALIFATKIMSVLWPSMTVSNKVDPDVLSHDEGVIQQRNSDPLIHSRVSARWVVECTRAMEKTSAFVGSLDIPLLMQVAGEDKLVKSSATETFFSRLNGDDKTIRVYEGMYHEIYNETRERRALVLDDLKTWIHRRFFNARELA